ncbi:MAG: nitroreductase family deazaflavin-dependent oxidoreductase [Acidimicrobiales bacterium]
MRVDGPVGRLVQKVAGSPAFARFAPPIVTPLDRLVHRLSGGRTMFSRGLVPTLMLTTTGAKTGRQRTVPLACMPDGDVIYLAGSNFGRQQHPGWSANLIKQPEARVSFQGEDRAVVAQLLSDDEKGEVWPRLLTVWPTYDRYVERSGRNIRVFRLDPVERPG